MKRRTIERGNLTDNKTTMDSQPNDMKRSASNHLASGAAAACSHMHKKSRTTDNTTDPSGVSGFIASAVVQYLGVRSLVRFGATSKSNKAVVDEEVGRRKEEISGIEKELKVLMGADHGERFRIDVKTFGVRSDDLLSSVPITRSNMEKAMKLSNYALRLIDDEIDFQRRLGTQEITWEEGDYFISDDAEWSGHEDIFFAERKKFVLDAYKPLCGSLVMLPECFYCPPDGEDSSKPSDDYIKTAYNKVVGIWAGESLMQSVFEGADHDWYRMDYEEPFMKFTLSGAASFTSEYMEEAAIEMAGRGTEDDRMRIEAFRIAARKRVFSSPAARDCLWYTISKADEYFMKGGWKEEEYESFPESDCSV